MINRGASKQIKDTRFANNDFHFPKIRPNTTIVRICKDTGRSRSVTSCCCGINSNGCASGDRRFEIRTQISPIDSYLWNRNTHYDRNLFISLQKVYSPSKSEHKQVMREEPTTFPLRWVDKGERRDNRALTKHATSSRRRPRPIAIKAKHQ